MGIKFKPLTPGPGPGSQCDRLIPIIDAKSNLTLNPNLPEGNVKDGKLDTMVGVKEYSKSFYSAFITGSKTSM